MKINWGTGIFIFYSFFVGALVFQVYKSTTYNNDLVAPNYYEKDLQYQSMYEKKQNSLNSKERLIVQYTETDHQVYFDFPKSLTSVKGKIVFYRADDKRQDMTFPIKISANNQMIIPAKILKSGYWNVEIDWENEGTSFFDEKEIKI